MVLRPEKSPEGCIARLALLRRRRRDRSAIYRTTWPERRSNTHVQLGRGPGRPGPAVIRYVYYNNKEIQDDDNKNGPVCRPQFTVKPTEAAAGAD